ncbi:hypothetical protein RG2014_081 [Delftia phage RG-2014]|uniref:Uncharacterized protein n=1 Tax=Delftia phage RG-2014 TaxID=1563661 RepID=A0A097PAR9_9CAUD|nr:hypothetical protein RG2014_081 [Delftia phage RG-2014]AIU44335.2 hypothetical protein RG2014_081 [Delftia phage RG-2014]
MSDHPDIARQMAVLEARYEENMKTLFTMVREIQQSAGDTKTAVTKMEGRLDNLDAALAKAQPTLNDYIEVKHKIVGAGRAGTYIWSGVVAVLSVAVFFKDTIFGWFSK